MKKTLFERMQTEVLTPKQIQEWYDNQNHTDPNIYAHNDDHNAYMIYAAGAIDAIHKVRNLTVE